MTTIIPTPAPVPDPLSSDFGTKAYDFTVWMAAAAPAMTAVAQETNDALNQSLLGMVSTTTSSITIAAPGGTVNFTTQANKGYAIGMTLKIASTANPANYVKVRLTAYNISTGVSAGTIISNGGSGTFASWSVFFDIQDPTILSVPTGEAVAAGNLLAIDDAGNSMSAGAITTAVLQAITATSLYACSLSNGNTAIFWTAGSTDLRMMIVDKDGATVLPSTSIGTGLANTQICAAQLTNGNIAVTYRAITTQYPTFKVINTAGGEVVAATAIEAAVAANDVKVCALTGGGFATVHCGASASKYAVYTNDGGVTAALATLNAASHNTVSICQTPSGGFCAFSGNTGSSFVGGRFTSNGAYASGVGFVVNPNGVVGLASATGSIAAASGGNSSPFSPAIHLSSDSGNALNTIDITVQNSSLHISFSEPINPNTKLGSTSLTVLGDGTYLAIYTPYATSKEYPRYVNFNGNGSVIRAGVVVTDEVYASNGYAMYAMPNGVNGFTLVWAAANRNIKFARVKSGEVVGVSLGAVGSTHQYRSNGSVSLASSNMLNVGGSNINYSRQGDKVVI